MIQINDKPIVLKKRFQLFKESLLTSDHLWFKVVNDSNYQNKQIGAIFYRTCDLNSNPLKSPLGVAFKSGNNHLENWYETSGLELEEIEAPNITLTHVN